MATWGGASATQEDSPERTNSTPLASAVSFSAPQLMMTPKGDKDKDRELSQAQAMVVRGYLAEHFKLDDARIKTMGIGKEQAGSGQVEILIYTENAAPKKTAGRSSSGSQ